MANSFECTKKSSLDMSSLAYRKDIDGLRTVAVLSVFLFHLNEMYFRSGFIGVDIFFVISGYLITYIIVKELESTNRIDLIEFYRKRVKRILPSVLFVSFVSLIFAMFILLPEDLLKFRKSLNSVIFFSSNYYFSSKSDYFAVDSEEFPLLHTWSLAVEEQFYFLWPLFLFLLHRFVKKVKLNSVIILSVIIFSICYAEYLSSQSAMKKISYFSLTTRVSELMIGGLLAFISSQGLLNLKKGTLQFLSYLGLCFLIVSYVFISKESIFPGVLVLLPCLGTAFIILSGQQSSTIVHKFLSLELLTWVGKRSYAIYLWHWPVLAFYRYLYGGSYLGIIESVMILVLVVAISHLSYSLLEVPANQLMGNLQRVLIKCYVLPAALLLIITFSIKKEQGFPGRIQYSGKLDEVLKFLPESTCYSTSRLDCFSGEEKSLNKIMIIGDSHGGHYSPLFSKALDGLSFRVFSKSYPACPPILVEDISKIENLFDKSCIEHLAQLKKMFNEFQPQLVIVGARWGFYDKSISEFDALIEESIEYIASKKSNVMVMEKIPMYENKSYLQNLRLGLSPFYRVLNIKPKIELKSSLSEMPSEDINQKMKEFVSKHTYASFFAPISEAKSLHGISFPIYMDEFLYYDGIHLNQRGSHLIAELTQKSVLEAVCKNFKNAKSCGGDLP